MNKTVQLLISTIFHPIFVNLLSLWMLFLLFPQLTHGLPIKLKYFMVAFIFISTSIIPLILVFVLRITGKIKSIMLEKKEDRRLPYLITTILYFFCYYNFYKLNAPPVLLKYLLGCCMVTLFILIVNHFYKISIHTATLGVLLGIFMAASKIGSIDVRYLMVLLMVLSGLVASARLFAKSHNTAQVVLGFCGGAFLMFIIL